MFEIMGKVDLRGSCVVLQLFYRTYKRLWGIQYCTPKQFSKRIKHVGCRPPEAGDAAISDGEKSVGEISGTCPQFRPWDRPDTAHPSKLHYPKSIRTAPKNSQKWTAFIFQKTINTLAAFPGINFLFGPLSQNNFNSYFLLTSSGHRSHLGLEEG